MRFLKLLVAVFVISTLCSIDELKSHPEQTYVYICDSTGATKYHLSSNCRGLNACEHEIIKVTKDDAYDKGKKTLCGWED